MYHGPSKSPSSVTAEWNEALLPLMLAKHRLLTDRPLRLIGVNLSIPDSPRWHEHRLLLTSPGVEGTLNFVAISYFFALLNISFTHTPEQSQQQVLRMCFDEHGAIAIFYAI